MMVSNEVKKETLERMIRIRKFEEAVIDLLNAGHINGAAHTSIGQEATIVGSCMALSPEDYMVGTHRSHGHPIGKGAEIKGLMAEICGRDTGVNRGKGGSMHLADFKVGCIGETSIVGSGLPLAAGIAWGIQLRKEKKVSLCFFGDGASSESTFHESLNLAAVRKLPVIFVCENNGYAVTNRVVDTVAGGNIAIRAKAYGIPYVTVDGQDPIACYKAVCKATERAREGNGPTLIEAKTMRFRSHAEGSLQTKMMKESGSVSAYLIVNDDVKYFMNYRDPIKMFEERLESEGVMTRVEMDALEETVGALVQDAVRYALNSSFPSAETAYTGLYAGEEQPYYVTDSE